MIRDSRRFPSSRGRPRGPRNSMTRERSPVQQIRRNRLDDEGGFQQQQQRHKIPSLLQSKQHHTPYFKPSPNNSGQQQFRPEIQQQQQQQQPFRFSSRPFRSNLHRPGNFGNRNPSSSSEPQFQVPPSSFNNERRGRNPQNGYYNNNNNYSQQRQFQRPDNSEHQMKTDASGGGGDKYTNSQQHIPWCSTPMPINVPSPSGQHQQQFQRPDENQMVQGVSGGDDYTNLQQHIPWSTTTIPVNVPPPSIQHQQQSNLEYNNRQTSSFSPGTNSIENYNKNNSSNFLASNVVNPVFGSNAELNSSSSIGLHPMTKYGPPPPAQPISSLPLPSLPQSTFVQQETSISFHPQSTSVQQSALIGFHPQSTSFRQEVSTGFHPQSTSVHQEASTGFHPMAKYRPPPSSQPTSSLPTLPPLPQSTPVQQEAASRFQPMNNFMPMPPRNGSSSSDKSLVDIPKVSPKVSSPASSNLKRQTLEHRFKDYMDALQMQCWLKHIANNDYGRSTVCIEIEIQSYDKRFHEFFAGEFCKDEYEAKESAFGSACKGLEKRFRDELSDVITQDTPKHQRAFMDLRSALGLEFTCVRETKTGVNGAEYIAFNIKFSRGGSESETVYGEFNPDVKAAKESAYELATRQVRYVYGPELDVNFQDRGNNNNKNGKKSDEEHSVEWQPSTKRLFNPLHSTLPYAYVPPLVKSSKQAQDPVQNNASNSVEYNRTYEYRFKEYIPIFHVEYALKKIPKFEGGHKIFAYEVTVQGQGGKYNQKTMGEYFRDEEMAKESAFRYAFEELTTRYGSEMARLGANLKI